MSLIKSLHKWLALVVGLQLMLWLISGFYFNTMDHKKAGGNQHRERQLPIVTIEHQRLLVPKQILTQFPTTQLLKLVTLLDQPYYLLTHDQALYRHFKNNYSLVNAYTGKAQTIDELMATNIAIGSYNGSAVVQSVTKLSPPIADFPKEKNTLWQVNFADDVNTSVYIDAGSGRIAGHSDDDKRLADFFMMLHFMDYANEGHFNNLPIIFFALVTVFLSLSGIIWTIELAKTGQYSIVFWSKNQNINVYDKRQTHLGTLKVKTNSSILDGLAEHDISLPSLCGGGGVCGQCKVIVNGNVGATPADIHHHSRAQLEKGIRLACQHDCKTIEQVTLLANENIYRRSVSQD